MDTDNKIATRYTPEALAGIERLGFKARHLLEVLDSAIVTHLGGEATIGSSSYRDLTGMGLKGPMTVVGWIMVSTGNGFRRLPVTLNVEVLTYDVGRIGKVGKVEEASADQTADMVERVLLEVS
jgi:hypothetical protein